MVTVLESESAAREVCDKEWKIVKSKNGSKQAKVVVEDKDWSNNAFLIGLFFFGRGDLFGKSICNIEDCEEGSGKGTFNQGD